MKEIKRFYEDEETTNIIDACFMKINDNYTVVLAYENHTVVFFDKDYNQIICLNTFDSFSEFNDNLDNDSYNNQKIKYGHENTIKYIMIRDKTLFVFFDGNVDFFFIFDINLNTNENQNETENNQLECKFKSAEHFEEKLHKHFGVVISENKEMFILINGHIESKKSLLKEFTNVKKQEFNIQLQKEMKLKMVKIMNRSGTAELFSSHRKKNDFVNNQIFDDVLVHYYCYRYDNKERAYKPNEFLIIYKIILLLM